MRRVASVKHKRDGWYFYDANGNQIGILWFWRGNDFCGLGRAEELGLEITDVCDKHWRVSLIGEKMEHLPEAIKSLLENHKHMSKRMALDTWIWFQGFAHRVYPKEIAHPPGRCWVCEQEQAVPEAEDIDPK